MLLSDGCEDFVNDLICDELDMRSTARRVDRVHEADLLELARFREGRADFPSLANCFVDLENLSVLLLLVFEVEVSVSKEVLYSCNLLSI